MSIRTKCRSGIKRMQRGWHYIRGTLTPLEAAQIETECRDIVGAWPLLTIDVQEVHKSAIDHFGYHPAMIFYVHEACRIVASRWPHDETATESATDWALDLIRRSIAAEQEDNSQ